MESDPQSKFKDDFHEVYAIRKHNLVSSLHRLARRRLELAETHPIFVMTGGTIPSMTSTVGEIHEVSLEFVT